LYLFQSVSQYHSDLRGGRITCKKVVEQYVQKINERKNLNAYVEVFEQDAIALAESLDASRERGDSLGKMHGVVVSIKDVICYAGHKVSAGSKILENFTSIYHATAVEKLLAEGAIIIGRTNCDEFAMGSTNENSAHGKVHNAADPNRIPGGSSGGAAVSVQAGLCMLALGSDTGGSVRQPADHCGIIGLKPSYGRISRYGLIAYASSFDQIGIFGIHMEDVALTLEVIAGADDFDSTASQTDVPDYSQNLQPGDKKYKIAYFPETLEHPAIDAEISANLRQLLKKLQDEGHTVEAVPFDMLDFIVPTYYVLTTAEASSNLSRFDGVKFGYRSAKPLENLDDLYKFTRSEGFGLEVKRRIMLGTFVLSAGYYDAYFTQAQKVRELLIRTTTLIFNEFDLILMPTTTTTAYPFGNEPTDPIQMYLTDIYTVMANLVGIPAISIPLFTHSNKMPFGVQLMADKENEVPLLAFSSMLMEKGN